MEKIEGSCHCGQVKWTYEGVLESVTACNCTICRRYGALWGYGFLNEAIRVEGETKSYQRGKAIDYHFCPRCGCATHYIAIKKEENGKQKAVVNMRMINEPEKIQLLPIDHFDGLVDFEDLPRDGRCVKDLWF